MTVIWKVNSHSWLEMRYLFVASLFSSSLQQASNPCNNLYRYNLIYFFDAMAFTFLFPPLLSITSSTLSSPQTSPYLYFSLSSSVSSSVLPSHPSLCPLLFLTGILFSCCMFSERKKIYSDEFNVRENYYNWRIHNKEELS